MQHSLAPYCLKPGFSQVQPWNTDWRHQCYRELIRNQNLGCHLRPTLSESEIRSPGDSHDFGIWGSEDCRMLTWPFTPWYLCSLSCLISTLISQTHHTQCLSAAPTCPLLPPSLWMHGALCLEHSPYLHFQLPATIPSFVQRLESYWSSSAPISPPTSGWLHCPIIQSLSQPAQCLRIC